MDMILVEKVIGLFLTLFVFSYLIKPGRFFRIAEHIFLGLNYGYVLVIGIKTFYSVFWVNVFEKEMYLGLVGLFLGVLMYSRIIPGIPPSYRRFPMAILIGCSVGLAGTMSLEAGILQQLISTIKLPLTTAGLLTNSSNLIYMISLFTSVFYFTFTWKGGKVGENIRLLGRYFVLVMIGVLYGNVIMTRLPGFENRMRVLATPEGLVIVLVFSVIYYANHVYDKRQTQERVESPLD